MNHLLQRAKDLFEDLGLAPPTKTSTHLVRDTVKGRYSGGLCEVTFVHGQPPEYRIDGRIVSSNFEDFERVVRGLPRSDKT